MVILIRLIYFHDSLNVALILASFNMYGMKLDEVHFSLGTVITHFLDKPYQESNVKSHLNSVLPCE